MSKRILVVDDSSIMRRMIRETLLSDNHQIVGEANNGLDAVELYKTLHPDVVTMDITMRGMDGFTAAREILNYDAGARIVFLSNLDAKTNGEKAEHLGAVGYVAKQEAKAILEMVRG